MLNKKIFPVLLHWTNCEMMMEGSFLVIHNLQYLSQIHCCQISSFCLHNLQVNTIHPFLEYSMAVYLNKGCFSFLGFLKLVNPKEETSSSMKALFLVCIFSNLWMHELLIARPHIIQDMTLKIKFLCCLLWWKQITNKGQKFFYSMLWKF